MGRKMQWYRTFGGVKHYPWNFKHIGTDFYNKDLAKKNSIKLKKTIGKKTVVKRTAGDYYRVYVPFGKKKK